MSTSTKGAGAVAAAFGASVLASAGLAIVYIAGGSPPIEGALLLVALGGIGAGLVLWAKRFLPVGDDVQEREPLPSTPDERARASDSFGAGADLVARRRVVLRLGAPGPGAPRLAPPF